MPTAKIGTVSHGTLEIPTLLQRFAREIEYLMDSSTPRIFDTSREPTFLKTSLARTYADCASTNTHLELNELMCELLTELIDILDKLAPPFCYFGSHPGDASDFGFWPNWETIEQLPHIPQTQSIPLDRTVVLAHSTGTHISIYQSGQHLITLEAEHPTATPEG